MKNKPAWYCLNCTIDLGQSESRVIKYYCNIYCLSVVEGQSWSLQILSVDVAQHYVENSESSTFWHKIIHWTMLFGHPFTQTQYLPGLGIFIMSLGPAWSPKVWFSLYGLNSHFEKIVVLLTQKLTFWTANSCVAFMIWKLNSV